MQIADVTSAYVAEQSPFNTSPTNSLGRDEFLSLLVTQLKHQNPIEPVDNQEFIAQLSQFSSLEQLEGMRSSIDESTELQRSLNSTMAVSLLGRDVEVPGNSVLLQKDYPATLGYALPESADVAIEIRDVQGAVVRTLTPGAQPLGAQKVIWDGNDDLGNALPEGNYTYHVLAVGGGGLPISVQPFYSATVESVRLAENGIVISAGGREIPLSQIRAVGQQTAK